MTVVLFYSPIALTPGVRLSLCMGIGMVHRLIIRTAPGAGRDRLTRLAEAITGYSAQCQVYESWAP